MRQQAVDVIGVDADLGVVPVMGMPGGTQHAGRHCRRYLFVAVSQQQGIFLTALVGGGLGQQDSGLVIRARRLQAHAIQHAAAADGERFFRDVVVAGLFDELRCRGRDLRVFGHFGKLVFLDCHSLYVPCFVCPRAAAAQAFGVLYCLFVGPGTGQPLQYIRTQVRDSAAITSSMALMGLDTNIA